MVGGTRGRAHGDPRVSPDCSATAPGIKRVAVEFEGARAASAPYRLTASGFSAARAALAFASASCWARRSGRMWSL